VPFAAHTRQTPNNVTTHSKPMPHTVQQRNKEQHKLLYTETNYDSLWSSTMMPWLSNCIVSLSIRT